MDKEIKVRFEEKYKKDKSGCWLWKASCTGNGYGAFKIMGKQYGSHRASWMIYKGNIPKGKFVLHKCDNTLCVNPTHLFLGTHGDNMRDMVKKKRGVVGVLNGRSAVTPSIVKEIRSSKISLEKCAQKYGISTSQAGNIRRGESWKHIV